MSFTGVVVVVSGKLEKREGSPGVPKHLFQSRSRGKNGKVSSGAQFSGVKTQIPLVEGGALGKNDPLLGVPSRLQPASKGSESAPSCQLFNSNFSQQPGC